METVPIIRFAALAAALLASANFVAGDASRYHRLKWDPQATLGNNDVILCVLDVVASGEISVNAIMKCIKTFQILSDPIPDDSNKFVNFKIKNSENIPETGMVNNADLIWGKWQLNGKDVETVDKLEFDSSKTAEFSATGDEFRPSVSEGFFNIHLNEKIIADVYFKVPFTGTNILVVSQRVKEYICNESGYSPAGSLTIEIVCHKLSGSNEKNDK